MKKERRWEGTRVHLLSFNGLDDERVSALLRKVLGQKDFVTKDLRTFRKTVAGFVDE